MRSKFIPQIGGPRGSVIKDLLLLGIFINKFTIIVNFFQKFFTFLNGNFFERVVR